MTKLTIQESSETPTETIIKAAKKDATVTDSGGRKIKVRKLSPLDRMKLSKCVKAEHAKNEGYLLYAMIAYSVVSIDDEDVVTPQNELHLEAMIGRLDEEGFEAVSGVLASLYPDTDAQEVIEAAKK